MKTMTTTEEMKISSESPTPASFSSLPYDVVLNVLARISRCHHPTVSLVSKGFRSLLASPELDATRTLIGKTEKYNYLCLQFDPSNPCWFTVGPIPKQKKLISIPSFSDQHPKRPAVVSTGSEIYVIGGTVDRTVSRKVYLLDCRSRQWRTLPEMRFPRVSPAAGFIDGKIYVFGGCSKLCTGESWGEIYDPKTQTWEPLPPTTLTPDVSFQKTLMTFFGERIETFFFEKKFCFHGKEKILFRSCLLCLLIGSPLEWCDLEENPIWREVKGLEGLQSSLDFFSLADPGQGRRLTVGWVSKDEDLWCAEISFERPSREELIGTVEWSKILYTLDRSETGGRIHLLSCATVAF
ncbi:unnamed protein product [Microthlaspi erraticum]|uniref:Uncharacterized protein n=1 Tax=Microthlaspi erraticum TaxID=1685480 RepID=A0A6D2J4P3_9BRAS|nr:unnamed protein product [Microthlaspi erraticum]